MAHNHYYSTKHHHRSTFTFIINECSEERRENHCENREPLKQTGCFCITNLQRLLKEVGRKTLEWEDGGVVQYAKQSYNPEHLRLENLTKVRNMELILRILLGSRFANSYKLIVEGLVHNCEHKEIE